MALPSFEDQHTAFTAAGYAVTNEEPELFRELLGRDIRPRRAAGIVSGGEVLLSVLLPRCQEVIGIDHSYRALAATWIKVLLLDKHGPKEMRKIMLSEYGPFCKIVSEMADQFPEKMRQYVQPQPGGHITAISTFDFDASGLRREWKLIPDHILARAAKKLDRLKLVHGDLTDLKNYGQFDLLYVSNAFDHMNRAKKYIKEKDVCPLLKTKGFLLFAGSGAVDGKLFQKYREQRGYRTTWQHVVFRKMETTEETPDVSAISA